MGLFTNFLEFWETFPNFGNFWGIFGNFGNFKENLRNYGKFWGRDLGDIPASEETVTELRRVILATEQGKSRADVH